ncbi:MAG TPA: hypothetical protein VGR76_14960 [Candidatus Angelobacter sp.]|nr:hypothetical protein [Candidatus Angelobacter sp.]
MKAHTILQFTLTCVVTFSTIPIFSVFSARSFAQEPSSVGTCSFQDLKLQAFSSAASGINDIGAVVGSFSVGLRTSSQAFLLFRGKFTPFTFPGSVSTGAFDINNHAQIVGSYSDRSGRNHGFFVQSGGFRTIDVPGAANGTFPNGINNKGDIVGGFFGLSGGERSFLLHQGKFTFFRFPGSVSTEATSVNINSVIVGTYANAIGSGRIHGFMVRNGAFATLDFPGAINTFPARINDQGEIVGSYQKSDFVAHGFVLAHGKFTTIDKPPEAPGTQTNIRGVNNFSRIVGSFSDDTIFAVLAFQGNCSAVF